jgi:hypothetical protein
MAKTAHSWGCCPFRLPRLAPRKQRILLVFLPELATRHGENSSFRKFETQHFWWKQIRVEIVRVAPRGHASRSYVSPSAEFRVNDLPPRHEENMFIRPHSVPDCNPINPSIPHSSRYVPTGISCLGIMYVYAWHLRMTRRFPRQYKRYSLPNSPYAEDKFHPATWPCVCDPWVPKRHRSYPSALGAKVRWPDDNTPHFSYTVASDR